MTQMYSSLQVETKFDIMANYQTAIESKSVIVKNSPTDQYQYSLYMIVEPFPTFEEYINGNEFDEGELLEHSSNVSYLNHQQDVRRILLPVL